MKQRAGINFSIVATGFLIIKMGNTGVFAKETDLLKFKKKLLTMKADIGQMVEMREELKA